MGFGVLGEGEGGGMPVYMYFILCTRLNSKH